MPKTKQKTKQIFELVVLKKRSKRILVDGIDTIVLVTPGKQEIWEMIVNEDGIFSMIPLVGEVH